MKTSSFSAEMLRGSESHDRLRVDLGLGSADLESRGNAFVRFDHIVREDSDGYASSTLFDEMTGARTVQDRSAASCAESERGSKTVMGMQTRLHHVNKINSHAFRTNSSYDINLVPHY